MVVIGRWVGIGRRSWQAETMMAQQEPVLPDYAHGCVSNLVGELLEPSVNEPSWLPASARGEGPVVLLVLDGLGWEQLQQRARSAPTLCDLDGGPITTVAPSTTASALTSITTGLPPGRHGLIGYRMAMGGGDLLNVLRWSTADGDARRRIDPAEVQPHEPFLGHRPPVVTRAEFERSGFTQAHLRGTRQHGYRMMSSLTCEVEQLLRAGEPFVYAYYDGLDKISHEHGLGAHFDAELVACDRLVADLAAALPPDGRLVITADHGQVHTGDALVQIPASVSELMVGQSGEARFRWLHAIAGQQARLLDTASSAFGEIAWVRSRDQVIDEGWFGPDVSDAAVRRLGDVALVARAEHAFVDTTDSGPFSLTGRHGSLTSAEMYVPLLSFHR